MRRLLSVAGLAGLAFVLAACESDPVTPTHQQFAAPAEIQLISAEPAAEMVAGSTVSLRVLALDVEGNPATGPISFDASGGGAVAHQTRTTILPRGIANTTWTIGARPGTNTLTISAPGVDPITLTVEGIVGPPSTLHLAEDSPWEEELEGVPGQPMADDLVVVVTDDAGNPIAGEEVHFAYVIGQDEDGDDEIAHYSVTTDAAGEAAFTWTLPASGLQTLTAWFEDEDGDEVDALTVTAFGEIGAPAAIEAVSGDEAAGEPGAEVELGVLVTDEYGSPVADVDVWFDVISGDGEVFNPRARTNADGVAAMTYTFGEDEDQQIEASIGVASVVFTVTLADEE